MIKQIMIGTGLLGMGWILSSSAFLEAGLGSPEPVTVTQPSGQTFSAYIRGDERGGWMETLAGYSFCKNASTGYWEYATSLSKNGSLVAGGQRVGLAPPPGKSKKLRPIQRDWIGPLVAKPTGKRALWDPHPELGVRNLLVILVSFSDRDFSTNPADWQKVIFGQDPMDKSVARFYKDNSYDKVEIRPVETQQPGTPQGLVVAKLNRAHPNYGRGDDFPSVLAQNDAETEWINEALVAINPFVNFTDYDTNNNGRLTTQELNVYFVLAGYDASVSSKEPNIWAHAWAAFRASGIRGDGLLLENWSLSGELHDSDQQNPFGVIAHELGHSIFGLPDLYDTAGANSGMGFFSMMAIGSFGRLINEPIGGMTPGPLDPWSRYYLGWAEPRTFSNAQVIEFPPGLSSPSAPVLLPIEGSEEFFIAENFYPDSIWHQGLRFLFELQSVKVSDTNQEYTARALRFTPSGEVSGIAIRCGLGKVEEFPAAVAGQIALIQRGELPFQLKVTNAKMAGAIGVIVYNNQPGVNGGTLGVAGDYIPAVTMAPEAEALEGKQVGLKVIDYPWNGGLMVLHVDPTASSLINDSAENENQGVLIEEAAGLFGSLLANQTLGHVTHLFAEGSNNRFQLDSLPNSKTYSNDDSRVGFSQVSAPGLVMTARITRDARLAYVVPWVVNSGQWSSRIAFYNAGSIPESPLLVAVDRDGFTASMELPAIASGAVTAHDATQLFANMSGYTLRVYASETLYPSFLTFNLDAPSGASPAQTTGMKFDQLDERLVFGYLPSAAGGLAALVLVAPEAGESANNTIKVSLHDANGLVIADRDVTLVGSQPLATVLSDLFNVQVEEGAVVAVAEPGLRLSGTTFSFNASLEPAMALPFPDRPFTTYALPWIVSSDVWSSRVALFNGEDGPATVLLTATDRQGERQVKTITVPGQSLWSGESGVTFPGLSGYGLVIDSDGPIFPNFLAFNLNSASGRSPAQTTGSPLAKLNTELVFPYVPSEAGGVSAIVLMAPLAEDEAVTPLVLSLHDGSGDVLETVSMALVGKRPLASVVADLFATPPQASMTVTAAGSNETLLTGTTFIFNSANEPSMSRAISPGN